MVGSRNVAEPGFNRAVEAQRPVGSLLKPFVYLLALAQPDKLVAGQLASRRAGDGQPGRNRTLDARAIPTAAAMARCG